MSSAITTANVYQATTTQLTTTANLQLTDQLFAEAIESFEPRSSSHVLRQIATCKSAGELTASFALGQAGNRTWSAESRSRFWKATEGTMGFIDRFKEPIGLLAGMSSGVGVPVWGVVCFVTTIIQEVPDTRNRLSDFVMRLQDCLQRYQDFNIKITPSENLRSSLRRFYEIVIGFCLEAIPVLDLTPLGVIRVLFTKKLSGPFDAFLIDLEKVSESIDRGVNQQTLGGVQRLEKLALEQRSTKPPSSSTAQPVRSPNYIILPDLRTNHFVGREIELKQIAKCLTSSHTDRVSRVAVWGIMGVGKTQVALQYAHQLSPLNTSVGGYDHVFWLRADSKEGIISAYMAIAHQVGLCNFSIDSEEEQVLVTRVHIWLSQTRNWLLVFDKVTNTGLARQFTPTQGHGSVLYTTTGEDIARSLVDADNTVYIAPLSHTDSVKLIFKARNLSFENDAFEVPWAEKLADLIKGLPITLDHMAKESLRQGTSLKVAFEQLQSNINILSHKYPAAIHEDRLPIAAMIYQSLQGIETENPSAGPLFRLLVYLDTSSIPVWLITEAGPKMSKHFARQSMYDQGATLSQKHEKTFQEHQDMMDERFAVPKEYQHLVPAIMVKQRSRPKTGDKLQRLLSPGRSGSSKRMAESPPTQLKSPADIELEDHYYKAPASERLCQVLENPLIADTALSILCARGLMKKSTPHTLWIHDLYAQIMDDFIKAEGVGNESTSTNAGLFSVQQEQSRSMVPRAIPVKPVYSNQVDPTSINTSPFTITLHLAMTLLYLAFPTQLYRDHMILGDTDRRARWDRRANEALLSALKVVEHVQRFSPNDPSGHGNDIVEGGAVLSPTHPEVEQRSLTTIAPHTTTFAVNLCTDTTVGPELCRLVATLLHDTWRPKPPNTDEYSNPTAMDASSYENENRRNAITCLELAVTGYQHAVSRLTQVVRREALVSAIAIAEHERRKVLQYSCKDIGVMALDAPRVFYGCAVTRLRDAMYLLVDALLPRWWHSLDIVEDLQVDKGLGENGGSDGDGDGGDSPEAHRFASRANTTNHNLNAAWVPSLTAQAIYVSRALLALTERYLGGRWTEAYFETMGHLIRVLQFAGRYEEMLTLVEQRMKILQHDRGYVWGCDDYRQDLRGVEIAEDMGDALTGLGGLDRDGEALEWFGVAQDVRKKFLGDGGEVGEMGEVSRLRRKIEVLRRRMGERGQGTEG